MNISSQIQAGHFKTSKLNPFPSKIIERELLSRPGSSKETYHIRLDLKDSEIQFNPGDAIGIFPHNLAHEVHLILECLGLTGEEMITHPRRGGAISFKEFLLKSANLDKMPRSLYRYLDLNKQDYEDLFCILRRAQGNLPPPQALADLLLPLMPRLYSIASSSVATPGEVDLLIATFQYDCHGRMKKGVGSSFLCEEATPHETPIYLYSQPNPRFKLPPHECDMIMIGPGTGIAPFRAFMQQRLFDGSPGNNWLFFGERNRDYDFYYREYWETLNLDQKFFLNTAFSRDQKEKHYVQHELQKHSAAIFQWIDRGAYLYICGDAKAMAKDVVQTLTEIIQEEGRLEEKEAKAFLREMRKNQRLMQDVY